jgi:hypothetical protein
LNDFLGHTRSAPFMRGGLLRISPIAGGIAPLWLKVKNPNAPAVKREAEEDWGR